MADRSAWDVIAAIVVGILAAALVKTPQQQTPPAVETAASQQQGSATTVVPVLPAAAQTSFDDQAKCDSQAEKVHKKRLNELTGYDREKLESFESHVSHKLNVAWS